VPNGEVASKEYPLQGQYDRFLDPASQMRYNPAIYVLFKCSLFLLFLQSMFAWFFWDGLTFALTFAAVLSVLHTVLSTGCFSCKQSNVIPICFLVIIQLYVVRDGNANAWIAALLHICIFSIVFLLKDQVKVELLDFFTKAFALLLSLSLIFWMLYLLGIPLPHSFAGFNDDYYTFDNHYFFLLDHTGIDFPIPRFSSVFLEPGQLGMITVFLLYANRFALKRKAVLVIFVATLLTFSLGAYLLLLISATAYIMIYSKKPMRNFVLWALVLLGIYFLFSKMNDGDNAVNNFIIARVKAADKDIVESDRFSEDLNAHFQQFMKMDAKWLGIGGVKYELMEWEAGNAGYKVFLLKHGIIGTLLLFLLYFSMVILRKSRLSFLFLAIYILSFIQRAYALWNVELLIFVTALAAFSFQKENVFHVKPI
jgi:hypothetical protein